MSPSIWTECAGSSEIAPLDLEAWRVVEGQHLVSTRKLVDSAEEQASLEAFIDEHKPPLADSESRSLHYLLTTPFRYPPLRHGSRFGSRLERGIWYGGTVLRVALAEVAYYRLLFLDGTTAGITLLETTVTAFRALILTPFGIDLNRGPFVDHRRSISSPTSYEDAQRLGREMREAGVLAFRYVSARDVEAGIAVGVFDTRAFASPMPQDLESWYTVATENRVEFSKQDYFAARHLAFPRTDFEVNGRLPSPAL